MTDKLQTKETVEIMLGRAMQQVSECAREAYIEHDFSGAHMLHYLHGKIRAYSEVLGIDCRTDIHSQQVDLVRLGQ